MPSVWLESRKARGGRVWIVRWETVNAGVRHRGAKACGPYKEFAEKFRNRKLEELYAGVLGLDPSAENLSWTEFSRRYLAHCEKHKARGTFRNFDKPAVDQFGTFIGRKPINRITSEDLGRWETELLGIYNANTTRIRLRALRAALNWAKEERIISSVPRFHFPQAEKVGRVLTDSEVSALLAALPDNPRRAAIFALHTGLRRGELVSLTWERIRKATDGHFEAEIGGIGGPATKTRQSRVVPLHPAAVEAMGTFKTSGKVFSRVGVNVSHDVEDAAKRAGLGRVRFHDLRHTWATRFMQATGDLFALMQLGGWKDMGSVKEYQHHTRSRALAVGSVNYNLPTNLPTNA